MNKFEEDFSMPVSPIGLYWNSSVLNISVLGVLESEIPIDMSRVVSLLRDVFLPINTRFSSIMIVDKKGTTRWKQVEVNVEEHIKVPTFPTNLSLELYDDYFDEYMSKIAREQLPQERPLWEIHIINYPTRNAAGTLIWNLHHALGDGYSLMVALFACLRRADDPSLPLTFPSSRTMESKANNKSYKTMLMRLPRLVSLAFNGVMDFGWSVFKGRDDQTPLRSGNEDVRFRPISISNVSLSLDSIKEVKNKLGVSTNDVLVGVIFHGIRLYMKTKVMNHKSSKAQITALVLLNTRAIRAYKSVKEMLDTNSEAPWGNRFAFMHIPIPESSDADYSNPLEFVWKAKKEINRKRYSLAVPLSGVVLDLVNKFKGPEAAARNIYNTLKDSSLTISHMIGPVERVAFANHPIKGIYFMTAGFNQSLTVTIMSYMGCLRVGFGVEKGFIDEHQFKSCFETSLEMMLKTARNIAAETK